MMIRKSEWSWKKRRRLYLYKEGLFVWGNKNPRNSSGKMFNMYDFIESIPVHSSMHRFSWADSSPYMLNRSTEEDRV